MPLQSNLRFSSLLLYVVSMILCKYTVIRINYLWFWYLALDVIRMIISKCTCSRNWNALFTEEFISWKLQGDYVRSGISLLCKEMGKVFTLLEKKEEENDDNLAVVFWQL